MKIIALDGYAANPGDLSWDELGRFKGSRRMYDLRPYRPHRST